VEAWLKKLKMPIWRNGKIKYISPEILIEKLDSVDCQPAPHFRND